MVESIIGKEGPVPKGNRTGREETVRERWHEEACRLVEEEIDKLYDVAMDMRQGKKHFEWIEREWRRMLLEFGAKMLGRFFEATKWTGYEGPSKDCSSCNGIMKFVNNRKKGVTTLLGGLQIDRAYYYCSGCGKGEHPLDRCMDVERTLFSPGVRKGANLLGGEDIFLEGEEFFRDVVGIHISEKSVERFTERTGEQIEQMQLEEIEEVFENRKAPKILPNPFVRDKLEGMNETPRSDMYVLVDGTMAPLVEGWKEVKLGSVFDAEPFSMKVKDKERLMPARGTTSYVGAFEGAEDFGKRVYVEACRRGCSEVNRRIVLGDGAHWIWNMAKTHFPDAIEIVDWYHADERLWEVSREVYGENSSRAAEWVEVCIDQFFEDRVDAVISRIKRLKPRTAKAKEVRDDAITYFQNNRERMQYKTFLEQGFYIGSGVVESGCRHVVGLRLKRPGMRWVKEKANAVLQVRIAKINRRFDHYWAARRADAA